jgi:hypothetical protein
VTANIYDHAARLRSYEIVAGIGSGLSLPGQPRREFFPPPAH